MKSVFKFFSGSEGLFHKDSMPHWGITSITVDDVTVWQAPKRRVRLERAYVTFIQEVVIDGKEFDLYRLSPPGLAYDDARLYPATYED